MPIKIIKIIAKVLLYTSLTLVLLLLLIGFTIQIPSVQTYIVKQATGFVTNKTHTKVQLDYIRISFPKSIVLEGLFVEDVTHDTLLSLNKLLVDVNMLSLFNKNLNINNLELTGATVKLKRSLPDSTFNFQFLIDAFAGPKDTVVVVEKEKSGKPFKISLSDLILDDVRFLLHDDVIGSELNTKIGLLKLEVNEINLDRMLFDVNEILLQNSYATFDIYKPSNPNTTIDTTTTLLPYLNVNNITISKCGFVFTNKPQQSNFDFSIERLIALPKTINLNNSLIEVNSISLQKPVVKIAMRSSDNEKAKNDVEVDTSSSNWQIKVGKTSLVDGYFKMDFTNAPKSKSGIDYKHLFAQQIHVKAEDLAYSTALIKGNIKQVSLNEQCGLVLKKLSTRFEYDNHHAELANLHLETPRTTISNYVAIKYKSIEDIGKNLGNLDLNIRLNKTKVYLGDVIYFAPQLINQPPFNGNADKTIAISTNIKGKLNDLDINNFMLTAGNKTAIQLAGRINGLPNIDKTNFAIKVNTLISSKKDIEDLVGKNIIPNQINLPDQFKAKVNYVGSISNFTSDVDLSTSQGDALVQAAINTNKQHESFDVQLKTTKLDLGYLLKNKTLGNTTANIKAKGTSFTPENMVADANINITSVYLNKYTYSNITATANANNGIIKTNLAIADKNVILNLNAGANINKTIDTLVATIDLKGANLKAIGLSSDDLRAIGQVKINVESFNPETMNAYVGIGGLIIASPTFKQRFDSITLSTQNKTGKHTLDIKSEIITANYDGNVAITNLTELLQKHIAYYINPNNTLPKVQNQAFKLIAEVKPHPIINQLILPALTEFRGIKINADYSASNYNLQVKINSPQLVYSGIAVKKIAINTTSNNKQLSYSLNTESIKSGNINLPQTIIEGSAASGVITNSTRIVEKDSGNRLVIVNEVKLTNASTKISIKNGEITLANTAWKVPTDNYVLITDKGININNLNLTKGANKLSIQSANKNPNAPLNIKFDDFSIADLSKIIENDTAFVRGNLHGVFSIEKFTPFAFTADMGIDNVSLKNIEIGDVKINANNTQNDKYEAKLVLSGKQNNATASGYLQQDNIVFDVQLKQISMQTIEAFVPSQISKSSGFLSGKLSVSGKTKSPEINGKLTFNQALLTLVAINNKIKIDNQSILLDNKGIHFNDFLVKDELNQPLVVDGDVFTSNFSDIKFNLDVQTKNFTVINTTARNNKVYYGKMKVNSQIKIRGNQNLPVIDAQIKLIEGSAFTFVVQQGDLSTDIGADIVQVIDKDTNVFMKFADSSLLRTSTFKGIVLNANVEVDKHTKFTVIIDTESGDKLVVEGDAILAFGIDQSGKISLVGTYTLNDGSYRASFQKVITREFMIKQGSTITWAGDPLEASIDITTLYEKKSTSLDLLAAEIQGMSENERNAYRKLLEFQINLMIKGELLRPEISFLISLSDRDKNAFGGVVDAKLTSINNDPNELNKQVFAFLILNKFLPPGNTNSVAASGTSNFTRNSVNQFLSDQLNTLSGKYIKGGELNVNIQSNDEYSNTGATQKNTDLEINYKQQLFNEKLSVQVGSNVNMNDNTTKSTTQQNITGDIVVEYKITDDGRYRFKAFRENNYEGLIDGMLYKTGVGIMYSRDYNKLSELLSAPKKEKEINIKKEK